MANATDNILPAATVEVELDEFGLPHRCSLACRHEGLCPTEVRFVSVTCTCGREFDDAHWFVLRGGLCPTCGVDLETPVGEAFDKWGRS